MPCPNGHNQPEISCKWCKMAVEKDQRYLAAWFEIVEPSWLDKVWNLTTATVEHITTGMQKVDDETHSRRIEICKACIQYDQERKVCKACGCHIGSGILDKARWASQKCPLSKW